MAPEWRRVEHEPNWQPTTLQTGPDTWAPGYHCVHQLENGNGPCGGNVYSLDQAIGTHCCFVRVAEVGT